MFNEHYLLNQRHNRLHITLNRNNIVAQHRDRSCYFCYPPEPVTSERFQHFWNWYTTEYPATTFTRYTQQYIEELNYTYLYIGSADAVNQVIFSLIFSIRYNAGFGESPTTVRQNIYNAFVLTQGFALDLLYQLYQISETTSIPPSETTKTTEESDLTILSDNIDNNLHTNSLLYTDEELNLENLFEEMAANQADIQALTAALQNVAGILNPNASPNANTNNGIFNLINQLQANAQIMNANPPQRESRIADLPYFYSGNQDPISWMEDFTRACNANRINDNRKLEVVLAYLKNSASTWWTTNQALVNSHANRITAWTDNNNSTDLTVTFPIAFRSQTLVEI